MTKRSLERVETDLAELRRKRSISAADLAKAVHVSRQTIYAIEAGDYVPNTAVALRLARALDVGVNELFRLPEDPSAAAVRPETARILPDADAPQAGQPVQLCRVDKQLMATPPSVDPWCLPASDAIVSSKPAHGGRTSVEAYHSEADFGNRILLAGCDPAVSLLARHLRTGGIELVFVQRNSSQALTLLRKGCVHIAGTHLRDEATGESNIPEIRRTFPNNSVALVSFAVWEEGILTARTNPKQIRGIEDLARKDVAMVNREKGAGSRRLLDSELKSMKLDSKCIRGYNKLVTGHFSAARQVAEGEADCCVATRATARVFGLDFVPLVCERYDLAIRRQHLKLPAIEVLLDVLNRAAFRRELEGAGGYETKLSGQRVI